MAQNVLDKEKIDTKENNDNTAQTSNIATSKSEDIKTTSKSNSADIKSSINDSSVNDISIDKVHSESSYVRKYIPLICVAVGILLLVCIFSTAFALANVNSNKIIEGVSVNGINLSGLTSEQATEKLSEEFSKKLNSTLTLTYDEYKSELIPSQDFDATYDVSKAVNTAYSVGRNGNLIHNNYEILASLLDSKNVNINLQYDNEKLESYISDISVQIPGLVQQHSYYIEDNNLIVLKGTSGIELLQDKTKNLILLNIDSLSNSNSIDLPIQNVKPNAVDIEQIHQEIYSEPQNAYIIKEPFELNVGSSGTDFAITLDEAKNLLNEEKDEYIIPLKITPPEVGVEDLGNDIFTHNLGTFTSTYKESNVNRSTNVKIASKKINNVILLPGEEFSYNKIVGERTFANGFKEASVYTSSGVVNGLGGGICQVSSTLYNAVLRANLEIVERRNHRYAVPYVPLGTDATVAYGSIDFRFKNNRNYPVKVVASSVNGVCTVSILGIQEETEYEVSITTKRLQTIPFETKYIDDSSMAEGTQKQTQYGDNGYKYETFKTLTLNGSVVSSEKISNDTYTPLTRVIRVGRKQAEVVTPPVETPQQTETPNNASTPDNDNTDTNVSNPESSTNNTPDTELPTTPDNSDNASGNLEN